MRHLLLGACIVAAGTAAAAPAHATEVSRARVPSLAVQRARSLARPVELAGQRDFTVITASKSASDVARVARYFKTFGFSVTETAERHNLELHGSYAQAAAAAHTGFRSMTYRGEAIVMPTEGIRFSADIAPLIKGTSFNPGAHAHPLSVRPLVAVYGPADGYGPADVAKLYDIQRVYDGGDTGRGVSIAIAACGVVNASDIKNYGSHFGLPPAKIHFVAVDGVGSSEDGEATLDAERVYGTAPGATIYEYLAPDCTDGQLTDVFARIAEDVKKYHIAAVSHSYGLPEADYAALGVPGDIFSESAALDELLAQHVPVFVSSGDNGAWGDLASAEPDVSYPASDPAAIAVGGTSVSQNASGGRLFEYAWGGSGGGVSAFFAIPAYQRIDGVASRNFKNVPDVALLADPNLGAAEYWANNSYGAPPLFSIGGTSVAAPTFAGIWALYAAKLGALHRSLPISAGAELYRYRGAAFLDITQGANGFYAAGKGYDNVTGIGVPDVARALNLI